MQSTSCFVNRDDNVPDESNFNIQSSNDQVDSEEDQFDEHDYEKRASLAVSYFSHNLFVSYYLFCL